MIFSRESDLRNDARAVEGTLRRFVGFFVDRVRHGVHRGGHVSTRAMFGSGRDGIDFGGDRPLACGPIDIFWDLLSEPSRQTIVHSGREEILFHYRATGQLIPSLFDIQIAAGFIGLDYPASYGNLVQRFTGEILDKEETRSDWRRRPLTNRQLRYASQDVRDLPQIYKLLREQLVNWGRLDWLIEETSRGNKILHRRSGRSIGIG